MLNKNHFFNLYKNKCLFRLNSNMNSRLLIVEVNAKNTVPKIINAYTVYIQTKRRITGAEATGVVRLLYCLAQKPNTVCILLATARPPRQARFLCGDSDYYMKNIYCMAKEKCLRVQYPIFVLFNSHLS